jgi:protein-tyrosine-phosphatase
MIKSRVLFLSSRNSCRTQMPKVFLREQEPNLSNFSRSHLASAMEPGKLSHAAAARPCAASAISFANTSSNL